MTVESKYEFAGQKPELTHNRKVLKRSVFISHSHADRKLANALKSLVEQAYSGVIEAFISSDPAPGGGIQPGDEWFQRIQSELQAAEAVWVLATKTSIGRPWIYWEAGLGRATCPGGVIVLRVGVSEGGVSSPLNQFQSYDGGVCGAGGIGELLTKVGDQIGMTVPSVLVEATTTEWKSFVDSYEPESETTVSNTVSPERMGDLEGLIVRLETAVDAVSRMGPPVPATRVPDAPARTVGGRRTLRERIEAGIESRRAFETQREEASALRVAFFGQSDLLYEDAEEFFSKVEGAPESVSIEFHGFDSDGDARFTLEEDGRTAVVYLRGQWLLEFKWPGNGGRTGALGKQLQQAIEEAEADSSNT